MTVDRRTVMTMLGLAPVGAIGAESFLAREADAGEPKTPTTEGCTPAQVAEALRQLATSVERGEALVYALRVDCDMQPGEVVAHDLTVRFAYAPKGGGGAV